MFSYLKFFLFHAVGLIAVFSFIAGGMWISLGLGAILIIYVVGDALCGDDVSTPSYQHPKILTFQLWMALPLLVSIVFVSVWSVCANDILGFGQIVFELTGYDALAAREQNHLGQYIAGIFLCGLMIGLTGTVSAHELTHRISDKTSLLVGRWLLAFSFDTVFSIEHVYGHHRYVATEEDPATAPRGRNVYAHIIISTIKGNISAWRIEKKRLNKQALPLFSWRNRVIRGHLMSALLLVIVYVMGGWTAALFFLLSAIWAKSLLEIVNYMEHYGIVRDPKTPVQPRHSWNTNKRISSWAMFNLTRHSHHHAQAHVHYQNLKPYPDAPMMIGGYLTTILVAMIPPLWNKLMAPKVLHWDKHYASEREQQIQRAGYRN